MTELAHTSFSYLYSKGQGASFVRHRKSPGGILSLLEALRSDGDMSRPAQPELVLHEDLLGGSRVRGNSGGGYFDVESKRGYLGLDAPNATHTMVFDKRHHLRSLAFPMAQWQSVCDEAADGDVLLEDLRLYRGSFRSPAIRSLLRNLWALSDDAGVPSRLLARAAGCEILAELCRLSGKPFAPTKGGLAPWAERRCIELMHSRLTEDISLDKMAAEVQLSAFHFARMFKQSVGVPPRVYLTRLRVDRACELLELTDLAVTEIALEVGYSSSQVLARVFLKHWRISPTDYRRTTRDPTRAVGQQSD